jgi:hypothetical protein
MSKELRNKLIEVALEWQNYYGVAPAITSALSEYDAAILIGCPEKDYMAQSRRRTAVRKGFDFIFQDKRYQVKGNRPSGKPGSKVTLVSKPKNYNWDYLIWIFYNTKYEIEEAWIWKMADYMKMFENKKRLAPEDIRRGESLYSPSNQ